MVLRSTTCCIVLMMVKIKMYNQANLEKFKVFLEEEDNFLLLSHVLPDGDSVGSTLAMAEVLKSMGKNYKILFRDPVPKIYRFLLASNNVYNLETIKNNILPNFIVLDCSEFNRLGEEMNFLLGHAKKVVNIDHHISNDNFGDIQIVKNNAAATCEVLYQIFNSLNLKLNVNAVKALYTGIVTDTGGFRYESTSRETFLAAADLIELGVDLGEIRENIYENKEWPSILILQKALNNLKASEDGLLAWLHVTAEEMADADASGEHCEGIVNIPLSITGVKMGFFFREMPDGKIKVGLRARRGYDVNKVAAFFGGGGHAQAAGCTLDGPLNAAILKVINAAEVTLRREAY